jgi:phage shock protein PspC (stress-responsive transcriptional regulator)
MPSLVRFLVTLLVLAGLGFAAMYVLANFVEPKPREMTIRIPQERLDPK